MEYCSKNFETDVKSTKKLESYLKLDDNDYDVLTSTELYITRKINSKKDYLAKKTWDEILSVLTTKLEGF